MVPRLHDTEHLSLSLSLSLSLMCLKFGEFKIILSKKTPTF